MVDNKKQASQQSRRGSGAGDPGGLPKAPPPGTRETLENSGWRVTDVDNKMGTVRLMSPTGVANWYPQEQYPPFNEPNAQPMSDRARAHLLREDAMTGWTETLHDRPWEDGLLPRSRAAELPDETMQPAGDSASGLIAATVVAVQPATTEAATAVAVPAVAVPAVAVPAVAVPSGGGSTTYRPDVTTATPVILTLENLANIEKGDATHASANTALKYIRDTHEEPRGYNTIQTYDLTNVDTIPVAKLNRGAFTRYSFDHSVMKPWDWRTMFKLFKPNLQQQLIGEGILTLELVPIPFSYDIARHNAAKEQRNPYDIDAPVPVWDFIVIHLDSKQDSGMNSFRFHPRQTGGKCDISNDIDPARMNEPVAGRGNSDGAGTYKRCWWQIYNQSVCNQPRPKGVGKGKGKTKASG